MVSTVVAYGDPPPWSPDEDADDEKYDCGDEAVDTEGGGSDAGGDDSGKCGGSCMSGLTGVLKVNKQELDHDPVPLEASPHLRRPKIVSSTTNDEVVQLQTLQEGDLIRGFDVDMNPTECEVHAIGQFGVGKLYGNYTDDHYIFNHITGNIEEHGITSSDQMTIEQKFEIFSSCPLLLDESGTKFTAIDSDFCGKETKSMSWSDYLLIHQAILRVVHETGGFWFSGSTYVDFSEVKKIGPTICSAMLNCMKDHDDCETMEREAISFIENVLTQDAKERTYSVFYNIGRHRELGSVSASVSAGKSVRN